MVQKLVARIGKSTDIPVLLVGEIGFNTDDLVARFGDGSSQAPRIMTDKSTGNFEYLTIDYVKYPQIQMVAGGTVDGVDLSELNTTNGFLVRNGDNSWSHRTFTNTDGYFDVLNGDGTTGNPIINASSALVSILTTGYLSSVAHDSTLTGNGTTLSPLGVTPASSTQPGSLSLATQAEVNAGIITNKAISPSTLQGRAASEILTGLLELATQAEVDTGTDTTRAITPATLNNKNATDTRRGVVELATAAEVISGIDTSRAITPAGLANYFVANPNVTVATQSEVNAGIVTNKYIAPNTLNARMATDILSGLIELATQSEVNAGTDNSRAVTALTLLNYHFLPPSGSVMSFSGSSEPPGWFFCYGQAISRAAYPRLFSAIGIIYGAGNGSTTFNVPDLRGEFVRGFDAGRGIDTGRVLGSFQIDEFKSHTHDYDKIDLIPNGELDNNPQAGSTFSLAPTAAVGGLETRPRNIAMNYIIRF